MKRDERAISEVPRAVLVLLAITLCVQIAWHAQQPKPVARAEALGIPPPSSVLRIASLGEPIALAQLLTLYLQAFDNQPGISIPFLELDYQRVIPWLRSHPGAGPGRTVSAADGLPALRPGPGPGRSNARCVISSSGQFGRDPDRRWRWLAHCAIMAKHRLNDTRLALSYADAIARHARRASNWARQMRIFILEDLGEREAATVLLGGLARERGGHRSQGNPLFDRKIGSAETRWKIVASDEKLTASARLPMGQFLVFNH